MKPDRKQFDELVENIAGVRWMQPDQGWRIWEHFYRTRPQTVLDVGTCFGASAAYMAGALKALGGGRVVTVDSAQFDDRTAADEWSQELWRRCGVDDLIEMVRIPHSNYAWWLMEQVANASGGDGQYDFAYLDGAKLLTMDTAAVVFIERLLRRGGWLLMDDLDWTFERNGTPPPVLEYTIGGYHFSAEETSTPHLRRVFDLVVKTHSSFSEFIEQDGAWGWAKKDPGAPKRVRVEWGSSGAATSGLGRVRRAATRALRRRSG